MPIENLLIPHRTAKEGEHIPADEVLKHAFCTALEQSGVTFSCSPALGAYLDTLSNPAVMDAKVNAICASMSDVLEMIQDEEAIEGESREITPPEEQKALHYQA